MTIYNSDQQEDSLTLFNNAHEYHEIGKYQEAEEIYRYLVLHIKKNWFLHYNFALLLLETNRSEEALSQFLIAASLMTSNNDLYYNLALCQKRCGQYKQAVESYKKALELVPEDTDSLYNIAGCFHDLERFEEAIASYETILEKEPFHQSALNNIAYISQKTGRTDLAVFYYKQLLEVSPDHTSADHMLAALTGKIRSTAPLSYVRDVFNSYSVHYEESLIDKLGYVLPEQLVKIIKFSSEKQFFNRLLDLGCGTGLIGEAFKNSISTIHGIDLSSSMIEVAHNKAIYDQLITGDIHAALGDLDKASYDLLIAADVFTYVGKLKNILNISHQMGTRDCLFYFSVEDLTEGATDMVLRESGRFAHSRRYIQQTADAAGWYIFHVETIDLRRERDKWIKGAVYAMKKVAT
jgi:predicted TPR repeat methyltransferase